MDFWRVRLMVVSAILLAAMWAGCAGKTTSHSAGAVGTDDDTAAADDDSAKSDDDDNADPSFNTKLANEINEEMGFLPYLRIKPVRSEPAYNGFTRYYFSTDDIKCYWGTEANVAVSPGDSDNIMFFMEGGGASWPGYSLDFPLDYLGNIGFKNRVSNNPMRDWNFVYVPYCDDSIHAGNSDVLEQGHTVHHHGQRQLAAAAALAKRLFPKAKRVLVTGSSAGGFGTYEAWPIVKSEFPNAKTYIMSDSGVGFFNPAREDTWETIKAAWNLHLPKECKQCIGPIMTYLYELMMEIDPQLRVGMFSSWHDEIISQYFLQMDPDAFADELRTVTDNIKLDYPDRFARFFIKGHTHTTYQIPLFGLLLAEGPNYEVDGVSLYEWMGQEIYDEVDWVDHLEADD